MVLLTNDVELEVRAGRAVDVPLLLSFFRAMAAFEKLPMSATEDSLRAAFPCWGPTPRPSHQAACSCRRGGSTRASYGPRPPGS